MNGFQFGDNSLDYVLSFVSAVLAIFAGFFYRKRKWVEAELAAVSEDRSRLSETHKALGQEHAQLGVRFRTADEERSQLAAKLDAADHERKLLTIVGKCVGEVLATHKHGPMVANAVRAVAKRKGVLPEFEALLSSVTAPAQKG